MYLSLCIIHFIALGFSANFDINCFCCDFMQCLLCYVCNEFVI